jgi:sugar lactone lactonase YvrE
MHVGHNKGSLLRDFMTKRMTFNNSGALTLVDDDDTLFIADYGDNRIVAWKKGDNEGHVVAGGQGQGNGLQRLKYLTDDLVDNETKNLIICDWGNRQVVRWPLNNSTRGEVFVDNIRCHGLAIDK